MANIRHFSQLEAWRVNHQLVIAIYKLTATFPQSEKYGLSDQIRRAASSITANIAEGWGRYHFADKNRFYYNARGSSTEVQNHLILAKDLDLLSNERYEELKLLSFQGFLLLNGLIRSTLLYANREK